MHNDEVLLLLTILFPRKPTKHNNDWTWNKNKVNITKVLHDLEECIANELFTIPENVNSDDGDIIDTTIKEAPSKFSLANTSPDFGKVEDPFRELGPITVFSARRSWTAPRSVRLHKTDYQTKSQGTEEFGFSLKGDSPVMISHVDINSVADVSSMSITSVNDGFKRFLITVRRYKSWRLHCRDRRTWR